ncbi:zinc finger MYM-type protein 1-like [Trifolium pratense]|uniref:zinc finger MYM-type protein 1-like n=1 Tax=Trifolium pratense TaxID=57577 RepID=UPI001E693529|nr:zinc finger MYM-type protein 1-like [Trifolium pratense]
MLRSCGIDPERTTKCENIDADIVDVQTVDIENAENVNNNIDVENVVDVENENVDDDNEIVRAENVDVNDIGHDIFDPTIWDSLDSRMRDLLVTKGPKRDCSIVKGPKDKFSRRFLANWYTRVLPNGETFNQRLKEHETCMEHVKNMTTWYELRQKLKNFQTIDKSIQILIDKEKDHWKNVLKRIISIVKFLGRKNLAFRGHNEKLYQNSNDNFLGLIEMVAEFDPIVQEHVRCITYDNLHVHYLGHNIQNELILLLASEIKNEIIRKIKQAKYFSVILDCTPDVSHQEQMSLLIRYVNVSSNRIEESFLGFLNVDDTTGQGLFDVLQDELKKLDLDLFDVRGQGYDNGSNMKGKHQGVQKRFLDINPRAFYTPCGCHSLNLVLCDMANSCRKAKEFFGVVQRIYTIFANSTKRWQILKDNVKGLTPKSLSSTRWESHIDSVKAIRLQMSDFREVLLEVSENDSDSKIESEVKSLATNELGDFKFLVAIVIWYEILFAIHTVSKLLQSSDMLIDFAMEKIKGLISFFEEYRETGFKNVLNYATEIALELNIDPVFSQKRKIQRKRQFDENLSTASVELSEKESFRVNYFLYLVDQAVVSLKTRFEQYQQYESVFGFLFSSQNLQLLDDATLNSCCSNLEERLKHNVQFDVVGKEISVELRLLRNMLPGGKMGPIDILNFLKDMNCFPNTIIAYRILLTIPVTVASAEKSFSKLKLLKSYLRSTMLQERLNGLALIAIENTLLDDIQYEDLIDEFASKNAARMSRFK